MILTTFAILLEAAAPGVGRDSADPASAFLMAGP